MEKQKKLVIKATEPESAIGFHCCGTMTLCVTCLLCGSYKEFPEYTGLPKTQWVCDECKEAIAFIKDFKAGIKEVPADKANEIEASTALL